MLKIILLIEEGNWEASWKPEFIVTYDELTKRDANGTDMLDKADQVSYIFERIKSVTDSLIGHFRAFRR